VLKEVKVVTVQHTLYSIAQLKVIEFTNILVRLIGRPAGREGVYEFSPERTARTRSRSIGQLTRWKFSDPNPSTIDVDDLIISKSYRLPLPEV
jgi:hypothetical protein